MANKPLKTIKFPGLADTYTVPQIDNTLTSTGQAADAKKVGDDITELKDDLNVTSMNGNTEIVSFIEVKEEISTSFSVPLIIKPGIFFTNGYTKNKKYVTIGPLPGNKKYSFVFPNTYVYGMLYYTNDSSGSIYLNERTGNITLTPSNDFCVNIRLAQNTNLNAGDIEGIRNNIQITIIDNETSIPTFSEMNNVISESIRASKVPVVGNHANVNNYISECYIINGDGTEYVDLLIINDSKIRISIRNTTVNDRVCYLDTSDVILNKVYKVGEYVHSGISAYVVFKSTGASYSAATYTFTSDVYVLDNWRLIQAFLSSDIEKYSTDLEPVTVISEPIVEELYITGAGDTNINLKRVILSSGVGSFVIGDDNDWVSYKAFTQDNPAEAGKVYKIPQYNNSGIEAYVVFNTVNSSVSGTYAVIDQCKDLRFWKKISMHIVKNVEMNTDAISILNNYIGITDSKILFLGDSIFGLERSSTSVPALVGNYLHTTTYNCALGGTEGNSHGENSIWKYFDFTELSKAIVNGDFSNQIAHESDSGVPSYFASVFDVLSDIDFTDIDIICLTYGGNDYGNSHSNIETFVTSMVNNINRILEAYPNIRFLLMNPPYKRFLDSTTHEFINDGDTRENSLGLTLKEYADSYSTISEKVHAPYINAYDELGINRYNASQWFITNDGSHPSENGRKETAKLVSEYLKRMMI